MDAIRWLTLTASATMLAGCPLLALANDGMALRSSISARSPSISHTAWQMMCRNARSLPFGGCRCWLTWGTSRNACSPSCAFPIDCATSRASRHGERVSAHSPSFASSTGTAWRLSFCLISINFTHRPPADVENEFLLIFCRSEAPPADDWGTSKDA